MIPIQKFTFGVEISACNHVMHGYISRMFLTRKTKSSGRSFTSSYYHSESDQIEIDIPWEDVMCFGRIL